jgi:hypothetical protein
MKAMLLQSIDEVDNRYHNRQPPVKAPAHPGRRRCASAMNAAVELDSLRVVRDLLQSGRWRRQLSQRFG